MITNVLEAIGLRQAKREKKALAAEDLAQRLATGEADLTPEEIDAEAARLGIELEDLDVNVSVAERIVDLEEHATREPELRTARDAAGKAKADLVQTHFRERREMEDRHRAERAAANAEFDAARNEWQDAVDAAEELRDLRRCWPAGPVSSIKAREIAAANVMTGRLSTYSRDTGRFEMYAEDGKFYALSAAHMCVSLAGYRHGDKLRYEMRPSDGGTWKPYVIGFEAARPQQTPELIDA